MKEWMQSDQSKQIRLGKETVQKREKENGKWDPAFICICIPMHTYLIFYSLYIFLFFDSLFALPKDKKQNKTKKLSALRPFQSTVLVGNSRAQERKILRRTTGLSTNERPALACDAVTSISDSLFSIPFHFIYIFELLDQVALNGVNQS